MSDLIEINLIDEANSLYIQEQNMIYYDSRDAVFLLAESFSSDLTFVSTLPSSRLLHFASAYKPNLEVGSDQTSLSTGKIGLSKRSQKFDNTSIFSDSVEQIITQTEDDSLDKYFFSEEEI